MSEMIAKLITVEKLLVSQQGGKALEYKLYNGLQLMTVYFHFGDYNRILQYFDSQLHSLIDNPKVQQTDVKLCIYSILADSLMLNHEFKRASKVFYTLCKLYNKCKIKE